MNKENKFYYKKVWAVLSSLCIAAATIGIFSLGFSDSKIAGAQALIKGLDFRFDYI